MKIYMDEQGSAEWYKVRLGRPTASNFHYIVTPKRCELSKSAATYALKLCAERLLNTPMESIDGVLYMERGKELEPLAVRQYEFTMDVQTAKVGFITTDDGAMGCSPDRLVLGERKIALEVKCPSPHVHLGYLLNGAADEYRPQVQGQLLIAELDRVDLYSYEPRMPPALIQTTRNADYIEALSAALRQFNDELERLIERAKALGVYQAVAEAKSPLDQYEAEALARHHRDEATEQLYKQGFAV